MAYELWVVSNLASLGTLLENIAFDCSDSAGATLNDHFHAEVSLCAYQTLATLGNI